MSRHDSSARHQDKIATRAGADSNQQNATITIQYANLSAPKLVDSYNSGGNGRATWLTASAITSITFFSGNNLDSGTIKIYGIAG